MIKKIASKSNETFKFLFSLFKNKQKINEVIIEGADLICEAKAANRLKKIISYDEEYLANYNGVEQILLSKELYRMLCNYKSLPNCIGVAEFLLAENLEGNLIYLDGVQDPGNVGTIIRSALAFNFDGVLISKNSASPFSSKVVQASKGAIFHIPLMVKNLEEFSYDKFYIYGTSLQGELLNKNFKPDSPFILVMGSEGQGISSETIQLCNKLLRIPIETIDSLNVSVAAGIFMYVFGGSYANK